MKPAHFLDGYAHAASGIEAFDLHELTHVELVHVSVPRDRLPQLTTILENTTGLPRPGPGRFSATTATATDPGDAPSLIMWLAPDQFMMLAPARNARLERFVDALDDVCYATDQTDNWVVLRLTGDQAVSGLERICPLDLHESAMPVGSAARTVMEHLAAIILRETANGFLLLSPSSSARSFQHAVVTSMISTRR